MQLPWKCLLILDISSASFKGKKNNILSIFLFKFYYQTDFSIGFRAAIDEGYGYLRNCARLSNVTFL